MALPERAVTSWRGVVGDGVVEDGVTSTERLDRWLADRLERPRNKVQRWIRDGLVELERGGLALQPKPSTELIAGDLVHCRIPAPEPDPSIDAEAGALTVLYQDEHLVVVDKPAEMAVHPGAGRRTGTLAHRLLHHFPDLAGIGGPGRPGIVHRLDLDTTGVLVVARTEASYLGLTEAFARRRVDKTYLAIVYGRPTPAYGTLDLPIGRHPQDRKRMAIVERGRPARSHYRVTASLGAALSVIAVGLETGRTHQIRVHCKAVGHPLVGDPIYGEARWKGLDRAWHTPLRDFPRPALHAWRLAFAHPLGGERLVVTAPVPQDLNQLWQTLGGAPTLPMPTRPVRGKD